MKNDIFSEYGDDPLALFQQWYDEADALEPNDTGAICLATSDAQGNPSARMVLLKGMDARGFKFHTNENSAKGQDISKNKNVSFCLYWKSTRKQIRVSGTVSTVSDAESDAYFKTRPHARAIGAWASDQSQSYGSPAELADKIAHYEDKFKDEQNIPRPPYWKGYLIVPSSIEFWIGNRDRLHTRFIYSKTDSGSWDAAWLYP